MDSILVVAFFYVLAFLVSRKLGARERKFAMASFAFHVVGSVSQWTINEFYYSGGGGDFVGYQNWGTDLARLMAGDFLGYAPEVAKLALHLPHTLPFEVTAEGAPTGTMSAIAGFWVLLAGPALLSMHLGASMFAWFGQVRAYQAARDELELHDQTPVLVGFLLVPSVIFWGSGFAKEAFVLGFLGILMRSLQRLVRWRHALSLVGVVVGLVGIAILKPYTLFALVVAFAALVYADRASRQTGVLRIRPAYLVLAAAVAVGGLAAMSALFPEYGVGQVTETLAYNQQEWQYAHQAEDSAGGSDVSMGDGDATGGVGQSAFVPIAAVNSFFRPFLFEARSPPVLGAAMETTALIILLLSLLRAKARRIAWTVIPRTPFLVFAITFCAVFGIGVGLATANLGSLSRYRMPMMPFYVTTLLVLRQRARAGTRKVADVAHFLTRARRARVA